MNLKPTINEADYAKTGDWDQPSVAYEYGEKYAITVTNGTANMDKARKGTEVEITAYPLPNKRFDKWTHGGVPVTFDDPSNAKTTFIMPAEDVSLTATYKHSIDVNHGTADKKAADAGETVTITANPPPQGKVFDKWTYGSNPITFTDPNSAVTTFIMPDTYAYVVANYRDTTYKVTVVDGTSTGGSNFAAGRKVFINATPPTGKAFGYWTSDNAEVVFADIHNPSTSFIMPDADVTIMANLIDEGQVNFEISGTQYLIGDTVTPALPTGLSWDSAKKMLTLNGYNGEYIYNLSAGNHLNLHLIGDNTLSGGKSTNAYDYAAIAAVNGNINITGDPDATLQISTVATTGNVKNIWINGNSKALNIYGGKIVLSAESFGTNMATNIDTAVYVIGNASLTATATGSSASARVRSIKGYAYFDTLKNVTLSASGGNAIGIDDGANILAGGGIIQVSGDTKAMDVAPTVDLNIYKVTGSWDSKSVKYELKEGVLPIKVNNGFAYPNIASPGEKVTITWTPSSGEAEAEFWHWETNSGTVTLDDKHDKQTSFIMPNEAVMLTAYSGNKADFHTLYIHYGSADRKGVEFGASTMEYKVHKGDLITVTPKLAPWQAFAKWIVRQGQ